MKSSDEKPKVRRRIVFPREVLLVEIERHCAETSCNARARIGLTKEEARLYDGFECETCERWNADGLTERDIPDWWEELNVTGLATLREQTPEGAGREAAGAVKRLSEAWRRERLEDGAEESKAGDEQV